MYQTVYYWGGGEDSKRGGQRERERGEVVRKRERSVEGGMEGGQTDG